MGLRTQPYEVSGHDTLWPERVIQQYDEMRQVTICYEAIMLQLAHMQVRICIILMIVSLSVHMLPEIYDKIISFL